MTHEEFKEVTAEARKRVAEMDRIDGYKDRYLATILAALETGLRNKDGGEWDAFVMLQDLCNSGAATALVRPRS